MAPRSWRRAVAGLGVVGLLCLTAAGDPLADLAGDRSRSASQPGPQAGAAPVGPRETPEPSRQPAPDMSPAGATSRDQPSQRPALYTDNGIPRVALHAYRNAADLLRQSDPSCGLHWSLLAAVGRVESDHGRHGGSSLYRSGETTSPIIGPALDGSGGAARILDTDGGRLDDDAQYDRAVGPMQFLPGTWRIAGADGDGDGRADPDNLFDAALSAGRYLCAGSVDLSDPQQRRDAVYGYNHSASYVDLVLRIAEAYRDGGTVPPLPPAPEGVTPPQPLEPTPPESDLPPATSGDPLEEQRDGPKSGESDPPEPPAPNPPDSGGITPRDGGTPSHTDEPEPPGEEDPPPSEDESDPPQSAEPSEPPGDESPPPDDESPPPSDDGSPPPDGDEPAEPDVSDVAPQAGPVGTEVTITGSGLADADVAFGGEQATVLEGDADELVVEAPPHPEAGAVELTVRGENGESAKVAEGYTYVPAIDEIEPAKGSTEGGDTVELTGTSLADADVEFGGTEAETSSGSGTTLTVTTPPADEPGEVEVTAGYEGQISESVAFVYEEPSVSAEPSSGAAEQAHDGVTIVAGRTEFAERPEVTWSDETGEGGLLDVHERSETELVVSLPEHEPGAIDITVARRGAADLATSFTYRPAVEAVEPRPAVPGESATLRGSGLDDDATVTIVGRAEDIPVEDGASDSLGFAVPAELEPGHHELMVTTSGVSSEPYEFEVGGDE